MRQLTDMALRPIVLFNVAMLVVGPPLLVALWRYRDVMAAWKRPMMIGSYLSILCVTVVELTGATAIASYPRLASHWISERSSRASLASHSSGSPAGSENGPRTPQPPRSGDDYMKSVSPACPSSPASS